MNDDRSARSCSASSPSSPTTTIATGSRPSSGATRTTCSSRRSRSSRTSSRTCADRPHCAPMRAAPAARCSGSTATRGSARRSTPVRASARRRVCPALTVARRRRAVARCDWRSVFAGARSDRSTTGCASADAVRSTRFQRAPRRPRRARLAAPSVACRRRAQVDRSCDRAPGRDRPPDGPHRGPSATSCVFSLISALDRPATARSTLPLDLLAQLHAALAAVRRRARRRRTPIAASSASSSSVRERARGAAGGACGALRRRRRRGAAARGAGAAAARRLGDRLACGGAARAARLGCARAASWRRVSLEHRASPRSASSARVAAVGSGRDPAQRRRASASLHLGGVGVAVGRVARPARARPTSASARGIVGVDLVQRRRRARAPAGARGRSATPPRRAAGRRAAGRRRRRARRGPTAGPAGSPRACSGDEVGGGAEHGADLGDVGVLGRLGDAEVGELDLPAVAAAQQVAGLDVAVHDAVAVRVVEPAAGLRRGSTTASARVEPARARAGSPRSSARRRTP